MKICPKCGYSQFIVGQHVAQTVIVDGDGFFVEQLSACDEITHAADDDDLWECAKCHYNDAGRAFNKPKE